MHYPKIDLLCLTALIALGACGDRGSPATVTAGPDTLLTELTDRLASAPRSADDRARDAGRRPAAVLAYLGIRPAMTVIDLMAAGGWYSEVLAAAVGEDGTVVAQNPPWMLAFRDGYYGTALDARLAGIRVPNVRRVDAEFAALGTAQYDAALSALNFHDVYYLVSPAAALAFATSVHTALKPGGVFGIIDHRGAPGGDNRALHRIDKAIVVDIVTAAGFVVEGDSELLSNPADDTGVGVFSDSVRGRTDRFLLKLRKPAE